MEYDEMMVARLSVLETRMAALEQRQVVLETAATPKPKHRRELTPEERQTIRARLVAGQEKARAKREAEARAQSKASKNGKEAEHEG